MLTSDTLIKDCEFLLDTGANTNLLVKSAVPENETINKNEIVRLRGITNQPVYSLGSISTKIYGHETKIHLVEDNFLITEDGILGNGFFKENKAKLCFEKNVFEVSGHKIPFHRYTEVYSISAQDGENQDTHNSPIEAEVNNHQGEQPVSNIKNINPKKTKHKSANLKIKKNKVVKLKIHKSVKAKNKKSVKTKIKYSMGIRYRVVKYYKNKKINKIRRNNKNYFLRARKPQNEPSAPEDEVKLINELRKKHKSGQTLPDQKKQLEDCETLKNILIENLNSEKFEKLEDIRILTSEIIKFVSCQGLKELIEPLDRLLAVLPFREKVNTTEIFTKAVTTLSDIIDKKPINILAMEISESERIKKIKDLSNLDDLNAEERKIVEKILEENHERFQLPDEPLPSTNVFQHRIITTNTVPLTSRMYRISPLLAEELKEQLDKLLAQGIITPSHSSYSSPVILVPKKPNAKGEIKHRLVLDLRNLNKHTIPDAYPLPNILDLLDSINGSKYFCTLDMAQGFLQIELDPRDRHKTAFATMYGLFEYTRLVFGSRNAPASFMRLIQRIFGDMANVIAYIDDFLIHAKTLEHLLELIKEVMRRLKEANLKLQPEKCVFLKSEVEYLGHIITKDGVRPNPRKLEAVRNFPTPKNEKNIKQWLGLTGYYRRHIPQYAKIAKPLTALLKKDKEFVWDEKAQESFEVLKDKLCEAPILQYPDFSRDFILTTDASTKSIGAVLSQGEIGKDLPIAYASRVLNDAEQRYSVTDQEALAVVWAVEYFRPYLYGRKFLLVTDHKALIFMQSKKDPNSRVARWRLKIADFDYEVIYKPGVSNVNADALSRNVLHFEVIPVCPVRNLAIIPEAQATEENSEEIAPAESQAPARMQTRNKGKSQKYQEAIDALKPRKKQKVTGSTQNINSESESLAINHEEPSTSTDTRHEEPVQDEESREIEGDENIDLHEYLPFTNAELDTTEINAYRNLIKSDNLASSREKMVMRKDNWVYFTTTKGEPCDIGATELQVTKYLPKNISLTLCEPKFLKIGSKSHIILPVRGELSISISQATENIKVLFQKLCKMTIEKDIKSISIAKSKVICNIDWIDVLRLLKSSFKGNNVTKIIICLGEITIPRENEREGKIKHYHESLVGGHKGRSKVLRRIKTKYCWEGMQEQIQEFINQCLDCQLKKLVRVKTKQPLIITDTPHQAGYKICLDIVGPLKQTKKGNTCILTMIDNLTKYSVAVPLPDATASTVAEALVSRYICYFGAPAVVLSDQGSQFMSKLFAQVAKLFKIKQVKTCSYHHQSCTVERFHHTLTQHLKVFINKQRDNWDEFVDLATFSYNTSYHESTKTTPFELTFARIARVPSNVDDPEPENTIDGYLRDLLLKLHEVQKVARENIVKSKEKNKHYYDQKLVIVNFKVGDSIFLTEGGKIHKFNDQSRGPFAVAETYPDGNLKIKIGPNHYDVVHSNRTRKSYRPAKFPLDA